MRLDFLMMTLVVVVTVIGLQAVGLILVVALLIIPAATARFWTLRLKSMLLLSGAFGAISGFVGSGVSALLANLPAGAVIAGPILRKIADRVPEGIQLLDARYWSPSAATLGRLASHQFAAGRRDDLWKLAPRYSRRSAAEEKWNQRRRAGGAAPDDNHSPPPPP